MGTDDAGEFAGLVERQWRLAYKVAWAVLRNAHDAEDAAQEAFLKVLRARAWRGLRDERAFIARLAWRAAVDGLAARSRSASAHATNGAGEGHAVEDLPDGSRGPEAEVVWSDWEAAIHRLIDSLPEELRQPLALSAELNSREIAAALGLAEGTVRTRLMRARAILRKKLQAMEVRHYARR